MQPNHDPRDDARARGAILLMVRSRQREQKSFLYQSVLWEMLRGIGFDVGEYDVRSYLQDLKMLELIDYDDDTNQLTNLKQMVRIRICPRGLRVLDGKVVEESVER